MKTVLVPTDLTEASVNPAHYAADMAVSLGASLRLAYFVTIPVAISEVPVLSEDFDEWVGEAKRSTEGLKQKLEAYTHGKVSISISTTAGRIIDELGQLAEIIKPFAIVMCLQSAGSLERALFGSSTIAAMHTIHYPVIVVPNGYHFHGIKKIGLACGLHEIEQTVPIDSLEHLTAQFNSTLDIVYVAKNDHPIDEVKVNLCKPFLERHLHPYVHYVYNLSFSQAIAGFVNKENIDLLVVAPRHRSLLGSMVHKSVSTEIAINCTVPIMSLHHS